MATAFASLDEFVLNMNLGHSRVLAGCLNMASATWVHFFFKRPLPLMLPNRKASN